MGIYRLSTVQCKSNEGKFLHIEYFQLDLMTKSVSLLLPSLYSLSIQTFSTLFTTGVQNNCLKTILIGLKEYYNTVDLNVHSDFVKSVQCFLELQNRQNLNSQTEKKGKITRTKSFCPVFTVSCMSY